MIRSHHLSAAAVFLTAASPALAQQSASALSAQEATREIARLEAQLKTQQDQVKATTSHLAAVRKAAGRAAPKNERTAPAATTPGPSAATAAADPEPPKLELDPVSDFFKNNGLSLRRSATDQALLKKPAQVQFTMPDGKDNSYAIDAGLSWKIPRISGHIGDVEIEPSALAEYHRNTLTGSEANAFLAGINLAASTGDVSTGYANKFDTKLSYKRDPLHTGDAFFGDFTWRPYYAPGENTHKLLPNLGGYWGPDWLPMLTQPGLGIQFEDGSDIDKTGHGGNTARAKALIEFAAYPFANCFRRGNERIGPIEFTASYQIWENFAQSGPYTARDDDHELFKASLNYYFGTYSDEKGERVQPFAIGIDYVNGENPEEALKDSQYWQLAFKAMF